MIDQIVEYYSIMSLLSLNWSIVRNFIVLNYNLVCGDISYKLIDSEMSPNKKISTLSCILLLFLTVGVFSQCTGGGDPFCATGQCLANGTCTGCNPGFLPNINSPFGTCVDCNIDNCNFCEVTGTCASCKSGFSPNTGSSACISCNVDNCVSCKAADSCSTCLTGYTAF